LLLLVVVLGNVRHLDLLWRSLLLDHRHLLELGGRRLGCWSNLCCRGCWHDWRLSRACWGARCWLGCWSGWAHWRSLHELDPTHLHDLLHERVAEVALHDLILLLAAQDERGTLVVLQGRQIEGAWAVVLDLDEHEETIA
jgi:hypothetical protein